MADPVDLEAMLAAIRGGDHGAMQALYERYHIPLYRFCRARLGEREAAQDIVQEVFVNVWRGLNAFDYRSEAAFVGWLYTIASNLICTHLRVHRRQPRVSLDAAISDLEARGADVARTVCDRVALRQALKQLSAMQQHVIALRYFAGLSNRELVTVLDRPEAAIKMLLHRALLRLHEALTAAESSEAGWGAPGDAGAEPLAPAALTAGPRRREARRRVS